MSVCVCVCWLPCIHTPLYASVEQGRDTCPLVYCVCVFLLLLALWFSHMSLDTEPVCVRKNRYCTTTPAVPRGWDDDGNRKRKRAKKKEKRKSRNMPEVTGWDYLKSNLLDRSLWFETPVSHCGLLIVFIKSWLLLIWASSPKSPFYYHCEKRANLCLCCKLRMKQRLCGPPPNFMKTLKPQ